jgi:glycerol-3-phosphate acyltransferase PlsY
VFLSLVSYFLGSLNFSIIISKGFGKKHDIRNTGSKNAGFSNMLRSFGFMPALFTFAGDFAKSVVSVYLGKFLASYFEIPDKSLCFMLYILGFFCFLGHIYPIYFNFKGGKGILAAWAVNLVIDWKIFVSLLVIFLAILLISKTVSLSSMAAALAYPVLVFLFLNSFECLLAALAFSVVTILRHKSNLKRLVAGTENKIAAKK